MKNWYYEGKRYKNGNLSIRFSPDEIADINVGKYSDIELLSSKLERFDSYFVGESYCISNYELGSTIYNCYSDHVYLFNFSDVDILMGGKTLKLYAQKPSGTEREIITGWEYQ